MKKLITLFLLAATFSTVYATFVSEGNKKVYTFASLSSNDTSGVKKVNNAYVVSQDFTISATDTLRLANGDSVKLANGVTISIDGYADFTPSDTAVITRDSVSSKPKGFRVYADSAGAAFKNVRIEYSGLRYGSKSQGLTVDNCTFYQTGVSLNSGGSITFSTSSDGNVIKNSNFIENVGCAIGNGANVPDGIVIDNNYFYHNNTANSNRPQINFTCAGDYNVSITNNKVIGGQFTKVGGIGVSNMLALAHTGKVVIKNNVVQDNRYGITDIGPMDLVIDGNQIIDNKYETNANNGGSGISIYDSSKKAVVAISNNYVKGNLWGVTVIGGKSVNLGKTEDPTAADYNPGQNVFKDNANNGTRYDLYNNTTDTVWAQGNTWNVAVQDSASIDSVIVHKADNSALGLVIFMPPYKKPTVVNEISTGAQFVQYDAAAQAVVASTAADVKVYTTAGALVAASQGATEQLSVASLSRGIYIARATAAGKVSTVKFLKR
jgi:hypothetical protein